MTYSYSRAARFFLRFILLRPIAFIKKQSTTRLFNLAAIVICITYAISIIWTALYNALAFDGFAADGAFQLFDPLRRISAGQVIGKDFNFFHGIGVPLLHEPFYLIFGQGLFASELARWLVSPLAFGAVAFCFFYAFRRQFKFALPMTAIVVAFGLTMMPFFALAGNSLLGLRASMPVILLAVMLCHDRLQQPLFSKTTIEWLRKVTRHEALIGITLAISLLCGTEFGVAALLAFSLVTLLYPIQLKQRVGQRFLGLARIMAVFAIALLILLTIITHGNPFGPLKYAFVDIPADQSWYFGVPPNTFIHLGNAIALFVRFSGIQTVFLFAVMVGLMVWRIHRHLKDRVRVQVFICGLLAGAFAMISMLGYFDPSETYALQRMSLLVGMAAFILLWELWRKPIKLSATIARLKMQYAITPQRIVRLVSLLAVLSAFIWAANTMIANQDQYSIVAAARRLKDYAFGQDTNNLSNAWNNTDSIVMPIVQANNTVVIADINGNGFSHGISANEAQFIVDPGSHASFIRSGQIVYFQRSGRQIIRQAQPFRDGKLLVTLQNKQFRLEPNFDGAPNKLIVAQDFNHDNTKLWSLYSTLFEAEMGVFNPSGSDYIIHALGPDQRVHYLDTFKKTKPQFVVTLSRDYFIYEEWLQNSHWDLYSLIEQNYEVAAETPIHIIWKRKAQPWSDVNQDIQGWQKLNITIDNSIQSEKIMLPRPSFANVPDVDSFVQEYAAAERSRLKAGGENVAPDRALNPEQYAQYLTQQTTDAINQQLANTENSGPQTAIEEGRVNLKLFLQQQKQLSQQPYLRVPRPKRQVILVRLTYKITNPLSSIPFLGKTTRYFIEENNVYTKTPVSLRSYASQVTFPIVISEDNAYGDAYLVPNTYSLIPGGILHITSAEWTQLNVPVKTLKVLTDQMP